MRENRTSSSMRGCRKRAACRSAPVLYSTTPRIHAHSDGLAGLHRRTTAVTSLSERSGVPSAGTIVLLASQSKR